MADRLITVVGTGTGAACGAVLRRASGPGELRVSGPAAARDDGSAGSDGSDGRAGPAGEDGTPCGAEPPGGEVRAGAGPDRCTPAADSGADAGARGAGAVDGADAARGAEALDGAEAAASSAGARPPAGATDRPTARPPGGATDRPAAGAGACRGVVVDGGSALVVGAARHLEAAHVPAGARQLALGPLAPALDVVEEYVAQDRPVTVLASGDPGFFGIVRALGERFGPSALDVRPSAPSVAVAFARLGLAWDDAVVVSAHGRGLRTAVNVCRARPKAAVLTGPGAGPAELGAELAGAGLERTLVVAAALGTDAESVVHVTPQEAATRDWPAAVSVVLSLAPGAHLPGDRARTIAGPAPAPAGWALPEGEFAHRDSMVTKSEVRALVLARLGPRLGELVWDVGAGSGSVAVECARFGAAAVAVERDADGVARIRANAAAHGVDVQAVHGDAPAVLAGLPHPDAVFVGGGGSGLPSIVTYCARRARRTVVVTLAAVDRVPAVRAALRDAGLTPDGVLLQSSRLSGLPDGSSRLSPTNPVFVLWATRPAPTGGPR